MYTDGYDDLAVLENSSSKPASWNEPPKVIPQKRPADNTGANYSIDLISSSPESTADNTSIIAPEWTNAEGMGERLEARLANASETAVTTVLKTGILVYKFANMVGLPDLAGYAQYEFLMRERYWQNADFAQILETVFTNTTGDDEELRFPVLDRCFKNHLVLEKMPAAIETLKKHEAAAWHFGVKHTVKIDIMKKNMPPKVRNARPNSDMIRFLEEKNRRSRHVTLELF